MGQVRNKGLLTFAVVLSGALSIAAADVVPPAELDDVAIDKATAEVRLSWSALATDFFGNGESVDSYNIYRGTTPDFVPDTVGGSNLVGNTTGTDFVDSGALGDGTDWFYVVSAVDGNGNEGNTRSARSEGAPALSGNWTDTTIDLNWTTPGGDVAGFMVFYGNDSGLYDFVDDVGLVNAHSLASLATLVNWYAVVVPYDSAGNLGTASNEHIDAVAGRVALQVHNGHELCWGASKCPPGPGEEQRSNGWQLNLPTKFPEGDWTNVSVKFTMESRLCNPPEGSNVSKCGSGNPCLNPPCNGGYNTCGDPWDRTAHLFVVLDETCINEGTSCYNDANLELIRAVTPFGTDADPPMGTGAVPPRELTMDITPYAPLLQGEMWVGAHIGHFVQTGHWVTVDFEFSKRPEEASPKPPADGFQQVYFRGGGEALTPTPVTIPSAAQQVYGRFFITGHGGSSFCDGGFDDGLSCAGGCPGGSCQNCDEFCRRTHHVKVNSETAWSVTPWRDDCSPGLTGCSGWNACGFPSCTFSRAGWCPGYLACHSDDPNCDQDIDLTHKLVPGATHDVTWEIPVLNGSWDKSLMVYWYDNTLSETCGNGVREAGELCDGGDTGSVTCADQGWDGGDLGCNGTCDGYDEASCRLFECGNGVCEAQAGENCSTCPDDCLGKQTGQTSSQFCCGAFDAGVTNPTYCTDARCTDGIVTCDP